MDLVAAGLGGVAENSIVGVAAKATWAAPVIANSGSGSAPAPPRLRSGFGAHAHRSASDAVVARLRSAAKNSGTASSIALPPEIPSHRDLISPTSP